MVRHHKAPERGDYVWLDFSPVRGREQAGRRPALVVSRKIYNASSGLALVCPVTSQEKQYPFEVSTYHSQVNGVILVDQLQCIDWLARKPRYIAKAPENVVELVVEKIKLLVSLPVP